MALSSVPRPSGSCCWLPLGVLASVLLASQLSAQCGFAAGTWATGSGLVGVDGLVHCLASWDADGAGPIAPVAVVGGLFAQAGTVTAGHIATFEPVSQQWAPLGVGLGAQAWAVAAVPGGPLYVGGSFVTAGGVSCQRVARWNGSVWQPLGSGTNGTVYALALAPNGDLIAGGTFTVAGGVPCNHVARWNGSAWSPLGVGTDLPVYALAVGGAGEVYAAGAFAQAGGAPAARIARWSGGSWSPLGAGLPGEGYALAVAPNGELFAGGLFGAGVAGQLVARWNGSTWLPTPGVGAGQGINRVYSLSLAANGDVLVGGSFARPNGQPASVARWNGSAFVAYGGTFDPFLCFAVHEVAGLGIVAGGSEFAHSTGAAWTPVGRGTDGAVHACLALADGDYLLAGAFQHCGGVASKGIVRSDGSSFDPMGGGAPGLWTVDCLLERGNGELLAGGDSGLSSSVLRWNGNAWSVLSSLNGAVRTMADLGAGGVVLGGDFWFGSSQLLTRVALLQGSIASPLGVGFTATVRVVHVRPNGELIAGGDFQSSGAQFVGHVARWSGTSWQPLGPGLDGPVHALASLPDGSLLAGGDFQFAGSVQVGRLARWDGVAWSNYGGLPGPNLTVRALAVLPSREVAVGGDFTQPVPYLLHAGLNCSYGPTFPLVPPTGPVHALAVRRNGDVVVGGSFAGLFVGNAYQARLVPLDPAQASAYGSGCSSTAGPVGLTALDLPWMNAAMRARSTGIPANAVVVDVIGIAPLSTPLPAILPQGLPGCSLLATPDVLGLVLPVAGQAESTLTVPFNFTLLGLSLYQQHLVFEFGPAGVIALSGSNGLQLTIGYL